MTVSVRISTTETLEEERQEKKLPIKREGEIEMSLRQQAKILGISVTYLSLMKNGKRPWRPEIKARYDQLVNSLPESVYNNGSNGSARTAPTMQSQSRNVMVSRVGLEPTTLGLKVRCSTRLSYRPTMT